VSIGLFNLVDESIDQYGQSIVQ